MERDIISLTDVHHITPRLQAHNDVKNDYYFRTKSLISVVPKGALKMYRSYTSMTVASVILLAQLAMQLTRLPREC